MMDYLLGTQINTHLNFDNYTICTIDGWFINKMMIKKDCVINYNEKKTLVYD